MKRNAILTFADGYPLSFVEPFLKSWSEAVRSAELVLFTGRSDDALYEAAARLGVWILAPVHVRDYPLVVARNFVFRDFLASHVRNFDNVLLADSRDVIFQSDPFDVPRGNAVTFATEDNDIAVCGWNSLWLESVYESKIRLSIENNPICCAGTTIGSCAGILRYLDLICHESDTRDTDSGEQCFHNYIAYALRPDFIEVDRDDRIIETIGQTPADAIEFAAGRVTVRGRAAPVIHQYDRHPAIAERVRAYHRLGRPAAATADRDLTGQTY